MEPPMEPPDGLFVQLVLYKDSEKTRKSRPDNEYNEVVFKGRVSFRVKNRLFHLANCL